MIMGTEDESPTLVVDSGVDGGVDGGVDVGVDGGGLPH